MSVNSYRKGRRNEKKTQAYLEDRGWQVYTAPPGYRINRDIFHKFDHIARKNRKLKFIQTKTNYISPKHIQEYFELSMPDNVDVEVWVWKDRAKHPLVYTKDDKLSTTP